MRLSRYLRQIEDTNELHDEDHQDQTSTPLSRRREGHCFLFMTSTEQRGNCRGIVNAMSGLPCVLSSSCLGVHPEAPSLLPYVLHHGVDTFCSARSGVGGREGAGTGAVLPRSSATL